MPSEFRAGIRDENCQVDLATLGADAARLDVKRVILVLGVVTEARLAGP
jgi:hypothetical protein